MVILVVGMVGSLGCGREPAPERPAASERLSAREGVACSDLWAEEFNSPVPRMNGSRGPVVGWQDSLWTQNGAELAPTIENHFHVRTWIGVDGVTCKEYDRRLLACESPSPRPVPVCALRQGDSVVFVSSNFPEEGLWAPLIRGLEHEFPRVSGWSSLGPVSQSVLGRD